jgi:hypothetical protein
MRELAVKVVRRYTVGKHLSTVAARVPGLGRLAGRRLIERRLIP